MKRFGGLFDEVWTHRTLVAALARAATGKRSRPEVRAFMADRERQLKAIAIGIRDGSLEFEPYRDFRVRDTKSRTIHAPTFRDRVVHHAIIGVTGPVFERGAIDDSFACRRGRGQHAALARARRLTEGGGWYGKIDVEKFYDSVDHATLRHLLWRRFRETRLLALLDKVIDSYAVTPGKGLPIGALTSQYLGNFLLEEFDRRMKSTGLARRYIRYMDDIVIWADAAALATIRAVAGAILEDLGLRMKHGGEWNRCERGVPFLGFVIYPNRVRLGLAARRRLRRKAHAVDRAWRVGRIDADEHHGRLTALFAHACHADDVAWRRMVISFGVGDA